MGRRQGPRALARAALRLERVRGHPRVPHANGPAIFRLGRAHRAAVPLGEDLPDEADLHRRADRAGLHRHGRGEPAQGVLHPAADLSRLRARGREPDRHADRHDDRRLPVGQVPRRGRAHQGRRGEDRHVGAHGAEHAAGDGQGGRQLPQLAAAQARGGRGRLRRGDRAGRARITSARAAARTCSSWSRARSSRRP